jgi:hypothetical protein
MPCLSPWSRMREPQAQRQVPVVCLPAGRRQSFLIVRGGCRGHRSEGAYPCPCAHIVRHETAWYLGR